MISFDNTEVAFSSKSNRDLKRAYWLFRIIASPSIVKFGKKATNLALNLRLPISAPIKATIFRQFCGGETIAECDRTIADLGKFGIGTILDYSVEGKDSEKDFDENKAVWKLQLAIQQLPEKQRVVFVNRRQCNTI